MLLVKLADRLHNMRTLGFIEKPEKRRRIAQETVDIYAPLAGRIGMQNMREELEDLAFAELDPEARNSIVTHFARLDMVGGDRVGPHRRPDQAQAGRAGLDAWVYGRGKRPFSIWRKLQTKKLNFEQLSDIFGFRVIVEDATRIATARWASSTPTGRWCRSASRISSPRPRPTATARSTPR